MNLPEDFAEQVAEVAVMLPTAALETMIRGLLPRQAVATRKLDVASAKNKIKKRRIPIKRNYEAGGLDTYCLLSDEEPEWALTANTSVTRLKALVGMLVREYENPPKGFNLWEMVRDHTYEMTMSEAQDLVRIGAVIKMEN